MNILTMNICTGTFSNEELSGQNVTDGDRVTDSNQPSSGREVNVPFVGRYMEAWPGKPGNNSILYHSRRDTIPRAVAN